MQNLIRHSDNALLCDSEKITQEMIWKANFRSGNSRETYGRAVGLFMEFLGVSDVRQLREVTAAHVLAFRRHLQDLRRAASTVNTYVSALSSMFDYLVSEQILRVNPAKGVRRLKAEYAQVKSKCLTEEEARRVMACVSGDSSSEKSLMELRDAAILGVLFYCGCRVSEVCNLRVRDFFEEQGYAVLEFLLKGGKRNRVAIHAELKLIIERYLEVSGHGGLKDVPLFLAVRGNQKRDDQLLPLTRDLIAKLWRKYALRAGLEGTSPHSARATFITLALENKCPIEAVQKSVGHAQVATTQMYDKREGRYKESASLVMRY